MKLLRRVAEAEQAMVAGRSAEPLGLCWTSGCERVDRELQQGEYLAVDVFLTGRCAEVTMWRTVERITLDPEDRGVVYDVGGKAVGSVLDGSTPPYVTLAMTQDELLAAAEQHEG